MSKRNNTFLGMVSMHNDTKQLPLVRIGDRVDIIAPASRCNDERLQSMVTLCHEWGLDPQVPSDIFGEDILCANTDSKRLFHLLNALQNRESQAVICAYGGYGSMRLIPALHKLLKPELSKLFIGMSDITALNLFFIKQWDWPVLHAGIAPLRFSAESILSIKKLIFGLEKELKYADLTPLNAKAKHASVVHTRITGGNLTLVQASIGTSWQVNAKNKILFLEEVAERAYRVDRMLEHLTQANVFEDAQAILFGDFTMGNEPDGGNIIPAILQRFAAASPIPVLKINHVGHGFNNYPLPLNTSTQLQLGSRPQLIFDTQKQSAND